MIFFITLFVVTGIVAVAMFALWIYVQVHQHRPNHRHYYYVTERRKSRRR